MIYDHRVYTCRPGTLARQLALYAEHGYPAQLRHLGKPLIYAATETGDVNSYLHVWTYASATDREARRQAMADDPDWQAYLKKSAEAGYLVSQVNSILKPTAFFEAD